MAFKRAEKRQHKLRLALAGPSGSGKTYTALNIAQYLGKSIAVIDTENGSANLYADTFQFDSDSLTNHNPASYVEKISEAEEAGYDVIIVDSLSHAWFWELNKVGGQWGNWKQVRPLERALVQKILHCKAHIIITMRSKTEWVTEDYQKDGKTKTKPIKIGTSPVQSAGIEYEFDVYGDLAIGAVLTVSKTRCSSLADREFIWPGQEFALELKGWLNSGAKQEASPQQKAARVQAARLAYELDTNEVIALMMANFDNRTHPSQLSDAEIDLLITLIGQYAEDKATAERAPESVDVTVIDPELTQLNGRSKLLLSPVTPD